MAKINHVKNQPRQISVTPKDKIATMTSLRHRTIMSLIHIPQNTKYAQVYSEITTIPACTPQVTEDGIHGVG